MRFLSTISTLLFFAMLPSAAMAQFWMDEAPTQCGVAEVEQTASSNEPSTNEPSTDCSTVSDVDDPSFNVCFADANNPISTFPELLAQMQAERIAQQIVIGIDLAFAPLESNEAISLSQKKESLVVPGARRVAECSAFDQECQNAPQSPAAFQFPASPVPPVTGDHLLEIPIWLHAEVQNPGTPNPGLAPSEGHQFPLDEPPELT